MGRRARNRMPATERPARAPATKTDASGLDPARKTIAAFIVAAGILGVLTIVGIGTIGGLFGPILVFLVVLTLAFTLQRNVAQRLEGLELSDEDRLMRMLAAGVLVTAAVLALVNAVVSTVAS